MVHSLNLILAQNDVRNTFQKRAAHNRAITRTICVSVVAQLVGSTARREESACSVF